MEVDSILPASPQGGDARHPSPYTSLATTSSHTSILNHTFGGRKRRRSSRLLAFSRSPSHDEGALDGIGFRAGTSIEDEGIGTRLAKRRRDLGLVNGGKSNEDHQFYALGGGSALATSPHENEYGVDSPMYSLSLASPSPPLPLSPSEIVEDDIDMGDDQDTISSSLAPATTTTTNTIAPLIPRQVKIGRLSSTAPLRPSPLVHSEKFVSSSTQGSPSSSQGIFSSQSMGVIDPDTDRRQSAQNEYIHDTPSPRRDSPHLMRKALHQSSSRDSDSTDFNLRGKLQEPSRTPSPSPINVSSDAAMGESRKLHHSPGLSQTSFPGGKQLLRYTMGYREDCSACKSKTPGHYGHVMHH